MSGSEAGELEDDSLERPSDDESTDGGDEDVETVEIEPSEEELSGGLFDGVDDADEESGAEHAQTDENSESGATTAGPSVGGDALADVINEGAARLAVVGLSEEDFEDDGSPGELEEEFCEVFAAFRLGYFGQEAVEKHVLAPSEGEIEPVWGLLGSAALAAAVALSMRPDGSEQLSDMAETLNLGGD